MSIPSPRPQALGFFGTPGGIEPSPGRLSRDARRLPIRQFDAGDGLTRAFANALADPPSPLTEHA
jgi:hypothetical protein